MRKSVCQIVEEIYGVVWVVVGELDQWRVIFSFFLVG
jgi:hypothetical protein